MPLKPSDLDLRRASQINVIRDEVDEYMGSAVLGGSPLSTVARVCYYYLGLTGKESEERITEASFRGEEDDPPRQPGYYAVDVVDFASGKSVLAKPWYAVFRDSSANLSERRERTTESGFQDLMEEYRILIESLKRDKAELSRKIGHLQAELDSYTNAYNRMRQTIVSTQIERDKAVSDASAMEHQRDLALAQCRELEEESSSFKPHIKQMTEYIIQRAEPEIQRFFSMAGDGSEASSKPKTPKPPWSSPPGASARTSTPPRPKARAAEVSPSSAPVSEARPQDAPAGNAEDFQFDANGMPSPETLTKALYWIFWQVEAFGRFVNEVQKSDDGTSPFVPWWVIRGVVFYAEALDLGPDPVWPSDVEGKPNAARSASGPARSGSPEGDAVPVEIVSKGDTAGDDALDVSTSAGSGGDEGEDEEDLESSDEEDGGDG